MTLPEIPEDALDAALVQRRYKGEILAALDDAWPHLYATALRHAADELQRDAHLIASYGDGPESVRLAAHRLRIVAGEAVA